MQVGLCLKGNFKKRLPQLFRVLGIYNFGYVRSLSLLAAMERFKKSMGMTSRSSNSHVTPMHIWEQNLFKVSFTFWRKPKKKFLKW